MSTPPSPGVQPFTVTPTEIDGLSIITMKQITDERGTIREFYRESARHSVADPG